MLNHSTKIAITLVMTLTSCVATVVFGVAFALDWPLYQANLEFAVGRGLLCGVIGAAVLGPAVAFWTRLRNSFGAVVSISLGWAIATGFGYMVFTAAVAAC